MISDLLDRLVKAFMAYGKKKYVKKNKSAKFNIFFDVIDSFFNELIAIMFSQIRIMSRREDVAYIVSQGKRAVGLKLFVVQMLIILFVVTQSFLLFYQL
jgi:hypothetical protein